MKTLSGVGRRAFLLLLTAALLSAAAATAVAEEPQQTEPSTAPLPVDDEQIEPMPEPERTSEAAPELQVEANPEPTVEPEEQETLEVAGEERFTEQIIEPEFADFLPAASMREEAGRSTFNFDTEYRVRTLNINPIELNGETVRDIGWTEQRLRMNASWAFAGVGALNIQVDALDGVLFGDNGSFLGTPRSNSGVSMSTKRPNLTRWELGLRPGGDPLDRQSYVPMLTEADMLRVNFLYADAALPIGLLRVGRQPLNYGATITAHEGGRYNRWGVSQYADAVDRVLFATKLDQVYGALRHGANHEPNSSQEEGLIWAVFYDLMKQNNVALRSDNLRQLGTNLQLRMKQKNWFGLDWKGLALSGSAVHLYNEQFESSVVGFPTFFETGVENVFLKLQYMHIRGSSREISEGFAALSGGESVLQEIRGHGAQALLDLSFGPTVWTLEFNYASGDPNPRSTAPITSFSFARDMNVGLLLFEHIMAFESGRSVAVGIENLAGNDMASFPLTEVRSEGRFTNALAFFPQLYIDLLQRPDHNIHTRMGVLMAWAATSGGVIDPIISSINDVGESIADNAVNFHGGRPGRYYGTEFDVQLGYRFRDNFYWTLEGAMLLPGDGLHDEHGMAVRSFLVENRFEFLF
jgi:hypothetical protein